MTRPPSGSAIAVALVAIAALTTISLGAASLVPRDFRQSRALEDSLAAEQAAWSGVERALLALRRDPYYEQSRELVATGARPYGDYLGDDCLNQPLRCPVGAETELGAPKNQMPVVGPAGELGLGMTAGYATTVWHLAKQVGAVHAGDLYGGQTDHGRVAKNPNPILDRDAARVLDISRLDNSRRGGSQVTVRWAPITHSEGDPAFAGPCAATATFDLSYAWLTDNGEVYTIAGSIPAAARGLLRFSHPLERQKVLINPDPTVVRRLVLRFLATTTTGDDATLADCFARYSLEMSADEGADLGQSIIESTGWSGQTRRKIRVAVDRANGQIGAIFDFGLLCQACQYEP